jgi:hypothetical protein
MSRKISTVGLAALGVALVSAAALGACGPARGRGAAAEAAGSPPPPRETAAAAPGAAASVGPPGSTSVSLQPAGAARAAAAPRPGASVPTRARPEEEQDTSGMRPEPERRQDTSRARYPKEWEVGVPPGTKLDSLRREMDAQFAVLPPKDLEDRTPLPIWFRVYLRKKNPGLPTHGPYQYPRTARRLLQWMVAHPDSVGP